MSGPYVAFRVNRTSKAILKETITFEPERIPAFTNPFEWYVVCDSNDRVIVRALEDGKTTLRVIAVAELRGLTLVKRHQLEPRMPSMQHWAWLEEIVFPTRERGYDLKLRPAYDAAQLSDAALSPEEVWAMAGQGLAPDSPPAPQQRTRPPTEPPPLPPARKRSPTLPGLPSQRDARPPRPPTWPPPVPEPATPLWTSPSAAKPQAQRQTYLELLFDHAAVRVIEGSVRYAPDHSLRPVGFYQHKLICDPAGNVTILATPDPDRDMMRLATCVWRESALCDRKQDGGEPDDFQWMALEDALRAELSRAP
jgi:hypothetical protein